MNPNQMKPSPPVTVVGAPPVGISPLLCFPPYTHAPLLRCPTPDCARCSRAVAGHAPSTWCCRTPPPISLFLCWLKAASTTTMAPSTATPLCTTSDRIGSAESFLTFTRVVCPVLAVGVPPPSPYSSKIIAVVSLLRERRPRAIPL
jgi:hypothetical protein